MAAFYAQQVSGLSFSWQDVFPSRL